MAKKSVKKVTKKKKSTLSCPECGTGHIQTRISDRTRWCRRCGHQWSMDK